MVAVLYISRTIPLRNAHLLDILFARPMRDGFPADKEQLRQTIMKQEIIFRQQVHKLHRVYKIQRELMSDFRSTIQAKYLVSGGTSESSLFSSDVSSKDDKRIQHISDLALLDFSYHRPSMASIDVTQSCYNSLSGKTLQSTCVSSKHDIKSNNQESLNSKRKKRKSRLLDLELCADEYINDENELQRENEVPNGANFLFNRSNDVYHYRDRGLYHGGENVGYNNL